MNGIAANGTSPSRAGARCYARFGVSLLLSLAVCSAWALEQVPPAQLAALASETSDIHDVGEQQLTQSQLEVSAANLPRFDNLDGTSRSSRIDLTWLPPRQPVLGLAMGMSLGMSNRTVPEFSGGAAYLNAPPRIDLGFHWRYTMSSSYRIDFTAWHRMATADAIDLVQSREPAYGARVELGLGALQKRGFVADRGFVGLQLDGGARITMKRTGRTPMVYYRTSF